MENKRIECLDGLRGLAALWVLLGHSLQLTGWRVLVLSSPDLGVDLFIMLSGFLMVFHFQLRESVQPWGKPSTWVSFWLKRFFRIAPLYYLMLCIALLLGPALYDSRMAIDTFFNHSPQPPERYLDATLGNFMMHASFLFGLLPDYAFRTPLPDWSLGLEMQFYAAFPFVMLLLRRTRWIAGAAAIALAAFAVARILHARHVDFPMPSFLPLKIHIFLCGMLLANGLFGSSRQNLVNVALAIALVLIPVGGDMTGTKIAVRLLLVVGFFALLHPQLLPGLLGRAAAWLSELLGSPPARWLGELSFGVYLVHLLLLMPIAAVVVTEFGHGISAPVRFFIVISVLIPLAYGLAYIGFTKVEMPGQKLGRKVAGRVGRRSLKTA